MNENFAMEMNGLTWIQPIERRGLKNIGKRLGLRVKQIQPEKLFLPLTCIAVWGPVTSSISLSFFTEHQSLFSHFPHVIILTCRVNVRVKEVTSKHLPAQLCL